METNEPYQEPRAKLRSIRHDPHLVELIRQKLISKLHNLENEPLGPREAALAPVGDDAVFRAFWGAFLERTSNERIVKLALETMLLVVHEAPPGRTGIREIDEARAFLAGPAYEEYRRLTEV